MLERTRLACELAQQAGDLIRQAMGVRRNVEYKSAVDLVTDVDRRAQALIVDGIRAAFPTDAIVAEEDDGQRPSDGFCWYVDPLDGTINFVHALPHFAVSIAVLEDRCPLAAAVYDPSKDELFWAERGQGAFLRRTVPQLAEPLASAPEVARQSIALPEDLRLSVSDVTVLDRALLVTGFPYDRREHTDLYLGYFREFLCTAQDVRRYGSASLDLCYVAAGRFDGFWEWKLHPWDTAAGWLIVEEAGGKVSDFDGAPYDPWLPRILASNGALHDEALNVMVRLAARFPVA